MYTLAKILTCSRSAIFLLSACCRASMPLRSCSRARWASPVYRLARLSRAFLMRHADQKTGELRPWLAMMIPSLWGRPQHSSLGGPTKRGRNTPQHDLFTYPRVSGVHGWMESRADGWDGSRVQLQPILSYEPCPCIAVSTSDCECTDAINQEFTIK